MKHRTAAIEVGSPAASITSRSKPRAAPTPGRHQLAVGSEQSLRDRQTARPSRSRGSGWPAAIRSREHVAAGLLLPAIGQFDARDEQFEPAGDAAASGSSRAKAACEAGQTSSIVGRPWPSCGCTTSARRSSKPPVPSARRSWSLAGSASGESCMPEAGRRACLPRSSSDGRDRIDAGMRRKGLAAGHAGRCRAVPRPRAQSRSIRPAASSSVAPGAYHSSSMNSTSCCGPRSPVAKRTGELVDRPRPRRQQPLHQRLGTRLQKARAACAVSVHRQRVDVGLGEHLGGQSTGVSTSRKPRSNMSRTRSRRTGRSNGFRAIGLRDAVGLASSCRRGYAQRPERSSTAEPA